ncbi:MAG TPA: HBL/NHE enterotoxin family protein [Pyrinomonadaceae bacterium]|jgi:Mg2+ and Co2+ transporter CorA
MLSAETASALNTNDATSSGFASLQIVTAACHGVLNTQFIAPSPKPAWFDALNKDLDTAKVRAHDWIDNIAPKMTASIPGHVIDYASTYKAVTDEIVTLLRNNPKAKGKDDPVVQQVFELIEALRDSINPIIAEIEATNTRLTEWGNKMQQSHDDLFKGAASIQAAQIDLQAHIESMNNAIKGLKDKIQSENLLVAGGAATLAIGLTVAVVAVALAPVTGGASLVVAGIAGLAAIGGGVTWGVMQGEINKQFAEIAEDQKKIADDKRQLIALQGLSLSASTAVTAIATATRALSDVKMLWSFFQGELEGTLKKLDSADETVAAVLNITRVVAAQNEWNKAVEFAEQLVGKPVKVEVRPMPMAA